MSAVPRIPPDPVSIERQAAADVVMAARRVTITRPMLTDAEREAYAKRFESLALELTNSAHSMRNGVRDPEFIPPFITKGSAIPLTSRPFLRAETDAAFHE